jgi:hypothetical protein
MNAIIDVFALRRRLYGITALLLLSLASQRAALSMREKARLEDTRVIIKDIERAMIHYQTSNCGCDCPKSLNELFSEKYIAKDPVDGWGQPLVFKCPGEHNDNDYADVVSKGKDNREGTEDDIKSWEL